MNGDYNSVAPWPGAPVNNAFVSLTSNRASRFPATTSASSNQMAVPAYIPPVQAYRTPATSQPAFTPSLPAANSLDRDARQPRGTPLPAPSPVLSAALIRNLPLNTSEESLRLMMVFSEDLADVELMAPETSADSGFRSAILKFRSPTGAQQAKNVLDGKSNISNDAELIVEILGSSSPTTLGTRYPNESILPSGTSAAPASMTPSAPSSRQPSRFNGPFQPLERITPPINPMYGELAAHETSASYQNIFGPQSPIGNHLANGNHASSRSLIDTPEDDETRELLSDPVGFAENGLQRRQTAPQLPISRIASLSLNTAPAPPAHAPMPYYTSQGVAGLSTIPNSMPTATMAGAGMGYNPQTSYRVNNNFPPANPADQNPPCNTLYVGNLPIDTSEEELKALFSRQRGYKRLCFRTKHNGPMCFVEFEDVTCATKVLQTLYGHLLHNSVKGGIRLSFSKNPLGVRPPNPAQNGAAGAMGGGGPMSGLHPGAASGFTTASGPPPGLAAPPGLGGVNRAGYATASGLGAAASANAYGSPTNGANPFMNPWAAGPGGIYSGHGGPVMTGASVPFPPYMMGR